MTRLEVIAQIRAAIDLGVTPEAKVCLDTGLSQELHGRTSITVADLLAALDGVQHHNWPGVRS